MSAIRTQVYLTDEQRRRIDAVAATDGLTMADVIRHALDRYLAEHPDPTEALEATFGAMPGAETPSRETWSRG